MTPLLPAETLRRLRNAHRINVAIIVIAGVALAALHQGNDSIAIAAIVLILLLNVVTSEALRITVSNLGELRG